MYSSFHFLIEAIPNLRLAGIDECRAFGLTQVGRLMQLILLANLGAKMWKYMVLQVGPMENSNSISVDQDAASDTSPQVPKELQVERPRRASDIRRGRDAPFPVAPPARHPQTHSLKPQAAPRCSLSRRYCPSPTGCDDLDKDLRTDYWRGRTLQRDSRPKLVRSDSRTISPMRIIQIDSGEDGSGKCSRRSSYRDTRLLRIPPFPLPHRVMQIPVSEARFRLPDEKHAKNEPSPGPPLSPPLDLPPRASDDCASDGDLMHFRNKQVVVREKLRKRPPPLPFGEYLLVSPS